MLHKRCLAAMLSSAFALTLALTLVGGAARAADAPKELKLEKGDHISLIGNTLADRMQHWGWMETLLVSRFPDLDLTVRNLSLSGDEVNHRERSDGFGTPDEWLTRMHTDVIFAFFGFNESFAGAKGATKFEQELDKFVKATLAAKYNEKGAPRLVLFSPNAQLKMPDPNLPDPTDNNKNIKLYSDIIAKVAAANGVQFVDLFTPTSQWQENIKSPLTVNGIHLTEAGDQAIAPVIDRALFPGGPAIKRDAATLEKLRQAINDKNFYFFEHYRSLDGYNVYGGRSHMVYKGAVSGKPFSNREVMDREMEVLDVMAANRDKRVWAVAKGGDLTVDDSNAPPMVKVETNKPGPGPNGEWIFASGEDAIKTMTVGPGLKVNLFADEKMFPELVAPVQMSFDTKGRLWVAVWPSYPRWEPKPGTHPNDKILIFEDTKGTGKADKVTTFLDGLNCPTGFEFFNGGIIIAQAPGLLFAKDTTGGDHCNHTERLLEGLDSADTHHTSNSFTFDPGGALYFQEGTFMHSQIETLWGPIRSINGCVWRYEPRTQKFDAYASYGFANPHGHIWDYWGTDVVIDGTGAVPYYGPTFSGKVYFPQKHNKAPTVYKQRTRPCPGAEMISSKALPEQYQNHMAVLNVIGVQGILNYKLEEKGAGLVGTEQQPILTSTDTNFRPSAMQVGPDGAMYLLDWQNPIIGHLQHNLRDPSRDHAHGRIYRITGDGMPLDKPVQIAGEPIEKLLDLLKEPENRVRYRAKIELSARDPKTVAAAAVKWAAALDKGDANYDHNLLEALWVHQWTNVVNEDLLKQVLKSNNYHARAAATRVLCYWADRVSNPLDLLKTMANDKENRVKLEAVRACSFFKDPGAQAVALEVLNDPAAEKDTYLKYSLDETMKTLEKVGN